MYTGADFLNAIRANFQDDALWMIYSDWLIEQGDPSWEMFRQPRLTNSIGMRMRLIPPGSFLMGSPPSEGNRWDDETQHPVTIDRPFYLGVCQVTQAQWQAVMGNNPSRFKGDDRPVEQVSWNDCQEFCRRLSEREGKTYRLPTEAEWEYACRAGTTTAYYFGDDAASLAEYAWFWENSDSQTHPVGQKKPNAWGLHDMHGNVWEWCADWYRPYQREVEAAEEQNPFRGSFRVYRGGSWLNGASGCRAAYRRRRDPGRRAVGRLGCRVILGGGG